MATSDCFITHALHCSHTVGIVLGSYAWYVLALPGDNT